MISVPTQRPAAPWGSVAALLAACFATLAGVLRGVDPEIVLSRAVVAAIVIGVLTNFARRILQHIDRSG